MSIRRGYSLVELLVALVLIAILLGLAAPRVASLHDRAAVRSATVALGGALAAARQAALLRSARALVVLDSAHGTVAAVVDRDTLLSRALRAELGVELAATRDTIRYAPSGRGYGASNTTIIVRYHAVVDTIVVSRLGRVRD